ncbi:phytoene/squalene synthase family protein [Gemmata sp. JC673]|uniref:Phytoene/squalene synthase family protein n=1 Tax=Gemmata algarum TaxID=2975278 RepID=A0ABU5F497_9BACT|nr:phytoene/squalene synthase family protein [Gemmata algarum]MDY3562387.1 phytoene/squalene synthase family protein [Gemmata algarum]
MNVEHLVTPIWPSALAVPRGAPRTSPLIPRSFQACRAITAAANSSFPLAFRLLCPAKRRAMNALYAYMRVTDDLADEDGAVEAKRAKLAAWRVSLKAALDGAFTHPVHPALVETVRRYDIPPQYLFDAIDGMETDLGPVRMQTFDELYPYCYRVASAVGLACVRIWGIRPGIAFSDTDQPAEAVGIAFQLTNILRDLAEDYARERVYLPADELARSGCPPELWRDPGNAANFRTMMQAQVARAREYYRRGAALLPLLSREGRAICHMMCSSYRALLDEIERRGYDVFTARVRVPKWRKVAAFGSGYLIKWGVV